MGVGFIVKRMGYNSFGGASAKVCQFFHSVWSAVSLITLCMWLPRLSPRDASISDLFPRSVLNELRETWLKKLQDSGVVGDPNQEVGPQHSLHGTDNGSRPLTRPRQAMPRRVTEQQTRYPAPRPPQGNTIPSHIGVTQGASRVDVGNRQIQKVALGVPRAPIQAPMVISPECVPNLVQHSLFSWGQPPVGYYNQAQLSMLGTIPGVRPAGVTHIPASLPVVHNALAAKPGAPAQQQAPPNGYHQALATNMPGIVVPTQQQTMLTTGVNSAVVRGTLPVQARGPHPGQMMYSVMSNIPSKRKAVEGTAASPVKILKMEGNSSSIPGHIPQQDGAQDDVEDVKEDISKVQENPETQVAPREIVDDPLGSEEDPPLSDDEEEEEWDSPNFLTAQYDKVSRNKTRWRCSLRFGIFHANGRDYLFKTANGEFEF